MHLSLLLLVAVFDVPIPATMSSATSADSNTPRKRSRWEDTGTEDEVPAQQEVHTKRRVKPKTLKQALASASAATPPADAAKRRARPAHSIYVPPRTHHPALAPSRSVYCYERLNQIEEGSYGVVFRARDKETGEVVALKKLKLEDEKHGFPITALREINALMACRHENVVNIREVVVGDTLTQYVSYTCPYCPLVYDTRLFQESSSSWTS
jgi:cell division cycle 2-like protein